MRADAPSSLPVAGKRWMSVSTVSHKRPAKMRRAMVTYGRAAFDWTDDSSPHVGQGSSASSVSVGVWSAGRDQKSPLRRCFKSRPPLEKQLRPGLTPVTGLPSPEPPLAALAKPARNHRHVRNWARTQILCVAPLCKTPGDDFWVHDSIFIDGALPGTPRRTEVAGGSRLPRESAKRRADAAKVQQEEFDCPPTGNYS